MKMLVHFVCSLFFLFTAIGLYGQGIPNRYVKASYDYVIKKQSYKKRFGDITTSGRFIILKLTFKNEDTQEHSVNYDCFYLAGADGATYEVHTGASIVRQTRFEEWKIKDVDTTGFNHKTIKPNFKISGVLVFEVPGKGDYQLKFRGYLD